jgi:hypothetical protein
MDIADIRNFLCCLKKCYGYWMWVIFLLSMLKKLMFFFYREQERQCTYYVTLRHVRVVYALKSNRYYEYVVCVSAFACMHLRALVCGRVAGGAYVLFCLFSTRNLCAILWPYLWSICLHSKKNILRYCHKCENMFM